MTKKRAGEILKLLRKEFKLPSWREKTRNPFETLIYTVISQNTNNKNTARAFANLVKTSMVTPEALSKANIMEIKKALKVAGLYHSKAKTIKRLANITLEEPLDFIFKMPLEQARQKLLGLPGVGPKTADVMLLFSAKRPTLPIDTHINRVSKRLRLVNPRANYETVRKTLQMLFEPRDYYSVHVLLILHGRKYCKARSPLCKRCPIHRLCPSS